MFARVVDLSHHADEERRQHHHAIVAAASTELMALTDAANQVGSSVQAWVRLGLAMQCSSLAALEEELRRSLPTRRVWSMGQASMPVLTSLVNAVEKRGGADDELIARCRGTFADLGESLIELAEGR